MIRETNDWPRLEDSTSNAAEDVSPPVFWYLYFGTYGQVTMREDEALSAIANGAIVWQYSSAAPVLSTKTQEPNRKRPPCVECGAMTIYEAIKKCARDAGEVCSHCNELWG